MQGIYPRMKSAKASCYYYIRISPPAFHTAHCRASERQTISHRNRNSLGLRRQIVLAAEAVAATGIAITIEGHIQAEDSLSTGGIPHRSVSPLFGVFGSPVIQVSVHQHGHSCLELLLIRLQSIQFCCPCLRAVSWPQDLLPVQSEMDLSELMHVAEAQFS